MQNFSVKALQLIFVVSSKVVTPARASFFGMDLGDDRSSLWDLPVLDEFIHGGSDTSLLLVDEILNEFRV